MKVKVDVPQSKKECKNNELKSQGFYIQSSHFYGQQFTNTQNERVKFIASMKPMKPPSLGRLYAYPGECIDVSTAREHRRCGIATALLIKCLEDDVVTKNKGIIENLENFETSGMRNLKYGIWRDNDHFTNLAKQNHMQTRQSF